MQKYVHVWKDNPEYTEFLGVDAVGGLLMILNGIASILLWPFGYRCDFYTPFLIFRVRKGIAKRKRLLEIKDALLSSKG